MTFSERVKPLKDRSRLTLKDIAVACKISESMVSRYINGSIVPPEDIARNIIELLEKACSMNEKAEENNDMHVALSVVREIYEERINDLRANIVDLKEEVHTEKKEKWIFFLLFAIIIVFVFALLFFDIINGSVGWFRH